MDENRHPPLGGEREDGGEPRVVEAKGLSPWVELDPARARIQRAGRFFDWLLREVEPGERDEYAARFPRCLERAVVRRPECRLAVGLVQAEGERARDAVLREEGEQVVHRGDEAVDVGADVHVGVKDLRILREQRGNFVVVHRDEPLCAFQSVLHRLWNLPQLGLGTVPDLLIYGDTIRSPELRHEVPVPIPDAFIYAEKDGARYVFVGSLEVPRIRSLDGIVTVPLEELGIDELVASGIPWHESEREIVLRACRKIELESAITPRAFPLDQADFLRANGITLEPEGTVFDKRRRVKNKSELAGIRRAQGAAEAAMRAIRDRLREGGDITCEELQGLALQSFSESGVIAPDMVIVSHGEQTAIGHEPGHGPISKGEAVIADLYPQDPVSGCYADMTRTFCIGEPPEELVRYHGLVKEALDLAVAAIRPGITGKELHRMTCEVFQEAGFPTQLTKDPDKPLEDGFFHSLGHGVGLEVHEQPGLGRTGEEIVAGDVLAVEPGLYRKGFGGCRLEDLVLVTDDGAEVLTDFPYDLTL
jgi:Xaa-Pro aminopeptidase